MENSIFPSWIACAASVFRSNVISLAELPAASSDFRASTAIGAPRVTT